MIMEGIKVCQECGCLFDINRVKYVEVENQDWNMPACPACKSPYMGEKI